MAWLVELGDKELSDVLWPPRCSVCNRQAAEGAIEATGDHVVPIGEIHLSKEVACQVPCCVACQKRIRRFTIWLWSVMLLPWLLFLLATRFESAVKVLQSHVSVVFVVLCASMGVGIALFWCRVIYSRAVRLYMRGPTIAGIVFRHRPYAEEVARLNGLEAKKTFFLRGW